MDGAKTSKWTENNEHWRYVEPLLDKCVPSEDPGAPSDRSDITIRNANENANVKNTISFQEIHNILVKSKNNKAPRSDNFKIEVIKELWKYKPAVLLNLFNNCFEQENFPKQWKESKLKIILKDDKR